MAIGRRSVPVRADVKGKRNTATGGISDFHNIYDVFDFKESVKPSDFQVMMIM